MTSYATQPSGLPFASPSPSSIPEAFSFRRSFTSQLYTRAVATSIVYPSSASKFDPPNTIRDLSLP